LQRLSAFGSDRELQLESRPVARLGLDPHTTTVHLHDLLGNRETQAGAALGLSVRAVDLVERLEYPRQLVSGYTGTGVGHAHREVAVLSPGRDAYFAPVRELDRVAYEIEEHLRQALLVAKADRQ
jgi:hypothetical protein